MTAGDLWVLPTDTFSNSCPYGCILRTVEGHEEPHVCVGEQVLAALAPDVRFTTIKAIAAGLAPLLRERLTDSWMDGVLAGRRGPCVGDDDPAAASADFGVAGPGPCARCGCTDDEACLGGCYWVSGTVCSTCIERPDGSELIAAERRRQIETEGYDAEHDAQHGPQVLQQAAAAYLQGDRTLLPGSWKWKPKNKLRDLVRAGALYQAAADISGIDPFFTGMSTVHRDKVARLIDELLVEVRTIDRRAAS